MPRCCNSPCVRVCVWYSIGPFASRSTAVPRIDLAKTPFSFGLCSAWAFETVRVMLMSPGAGETLSVAEQLQAAKAKVCVAKKLHCAIFNAGEGCGLSCDSILF